ncbi:Gag-Pol polyprotein [Plecturocebus cupreus]
MWMANATFVTQSALDIHQQLQKLEDFAGMNATRLLEATNKVYVNRDLQAQREADKWMKQKVTLLAVALGGPNPTQCPGSPCKGGRLPFSAYDWHQKAIHFSPSNGKAPKHEERQLTWTCLPQGFKNSPTLFSEALATDLAAFPRENLDCTLVQHSDDLFLTSRRQKDCWEGTKALPQLLMEAGYKVSWKKAQICRQQVRYLGLVITKGHWSLGPERKKVICSMPAPNTK